VPHQYAEQSEAPVTRGTIFFFQQCNSLLDRIVDMSSYFWDNQVGEAARDLFSALPQSAIYFPAMSIFLPSDVSMSIDASV